MPWRPGEGDRARHLRPDPHRQVRLPPAAPARIKQIKGFTTGDLVRAIVPNGKKAGVHTGRIAVRSTGKFNITTRHGTVQGITTATSGYSSEPTATATPPIRKLGTVLCFLPARRRSFHTGGNDEMARSLWVKASAWTKDRQV